VGKRDRQRSKPLRVKHRGKVRHNGSHTGKLADAELGGNLPGQCGADEDRIAVIGNRRTGRQGKRRIAGDSPKQRVGVEQQTQALLFPRGELILRQGVEKSGIDLDDAAQRTEPAPGRGWVIGHELRDRMLAARERDFLARLDPREQLRKARLGSVDGHRFHAERVS